MTPQKPKEDGDNPAASMSLLTNILENALDPGYKQRAEESKVNSLWHRLFLGVLLAILVMAAVFAAKSLRVEQIETSSSRGLLMSQVEDYKIQVENLRANIAEVNKEIKLTGEKAIYEDDSVQRELVISAQTIVHGPGLEVTLNESEVLLAQNRGFVSDSELRAIVNILWSAGAEAIAVNDVRLGPDSTIRTAGAAILVDLTAVASPYTVTAIGNPTSLEKAVSAGPNGNALKHMSRESGYTMLVQEVEDVTLPAATYPANRYALPTTVQGDQ